MFRTDGKRHGVAAQGKRRREVRKGLRQTTPRFSNEINQPHTHTHTHMCLCVGMDNKDTRGEGAIGPTGRAPRTGCWFQLDTRRKRKGEIQTPPYAKSYIFQLPRKNFLTWLKEKSLLRRWRWLLSSPLCLLSFLASNGPISFFYI